MQRSKVFVVYRATAIDEVNGKPKVVECDYLARHDANYVVEERLRVTKQLSDALHFERKQAFLRALDLGGKWSVAELVSDRNGVHIEE